MFCKPQCFDISCFIQSPPCHHHHHLHTSFNIKFCIETHDSSKKHTDFNVLEIPNKGYNKFRRFEKRSNSPSVVVDKQRNNSHGYVDELKEIKFRKMCDQEKNTNGVNFENEGKNLVGKKVHTKCSTKCSTKWGYYGGCIPSILLALENVNDLDEAFNPWGERLSNKESSIILKQQVSWERAVEIFEWFKRKGCYELNVIHYNILLRILGKARRWDEVERLWEEMRVKSVAPINSLLMGL